MAKKKKASQRGTIDWKKARRLYEVNGLSFTEIGRIHGCNRNTVSRRAKAEGWVDRAEIEREASGERREKLAREFIERDGKAIVQNLSRKHQATTLLLDFFLDIAQKLQKGEIVGIENPVVTAGQAALGLRRLQIVDDLLAGLKDGSWRSDAGIGRAGADPHEETLQSALEALGDD